jgi:hypothetical protein
MKRHTKLLINHMLQIKYLDAAFDKITLLLQKFSGIEGKSSTYVAHSFSCMRSGRTHSTEVGYVFILVSTHS